MRNKSPTNEPGFGAPAASISKPRIWWRRLLSVMLLLHLTAVAVAPFAFASSGPQIRSPVAHHLMEVFRPYIQFAFLNHGYFFFAPNPGPSHLMRCRATTEDGPAVQRLFPDRELDYPRLLYHRHFMLSEQLNAIFTPAPPPVPPSSAEYQQWKRDRRIYEVRRASFIAHLKWRYGADHVELTRLEHRLLSPDEWQSGMKLDDRRLYISLPENPDPELIYPEELP